MRKLQAGLLGLAAAVMMTILPSSVYAYTEAEKKRAKAWLSSHGYPATKAGAYQAYDDWMNGKWWDEFGPPEGMGDDDDDDETKATAATQKEETESEKQGSESEKSGDGTEKEGDDAKSGQSSEDPNRILDIYEESSHLESSALAEALAAESTEETSTAAVSLEDAASTTFIFPDDGSSEEISPVTQKAEEDAARDETEEPGNHLPLIFGGMIALALILLLALFKKRH